MATVAEKFRLQCHLRAPLDLAAARLKLERGDLFLAGKEESASLLRVQQYGIATCDTEGQAVQQSTWHAVAFATRRRIARAQGEVVLKVWIVSVPAWSPPVLAPYLKAANDRARAWHRLTLTLGVAAERQLRDSVFGDLDRPLEEEEEEEERTGVPFDAFFSATKGGERTVDNILADLAEQDPKLRAEYFTPATSSLAASELKHWKVTRNKLYDASIRENAVGMVISAVESAFGTAGEQVLAPLSPCLRPLPPMNRSTSSRGSTACLSTSSQQFMAWSSSILHSPRFGHRPLTSSSKRQTSSNTRATLRTRIASGSSWRLPTQSGRPRGPKRSNARRRRLRRQG